MSIQQFNPEFSVRIVVCDHYLAKPIPGLDVIYSDFRGSDIKQVPVLRIFGPSTDGHKACLHVHGVFPYFYIPCPSSNPEPQLLYQIAASLDKALNIAMKQATSSNQHIYKVSLVKGLPFYGFHDMDHLYLKVFLYSPNLIKQAVELCSNGAILGQTFQPHESHLNFTLQFFIDFNLFGMSNIDLQKVFFRKKGCSQNSNEPISNCLKSESICFYEADCVASHILNRQRIGRGDGIENPGLEEVWKQEIERRKYLNMSMATKSLSQGRIRSEETESHYKFEKIALIKLYGVIDKPGTDIKKAEEDICYPAEMIEGAPLLDAVDVSIHLPENSFIQSSNLCETLRYDTDETIEDSVNQTIVDENVALNSSLSVPYSQILLNNEDLDLLDILQDMDEKPIEQDSIMGTPADKDVDIESDDAEYSQIFNEETILNDIYKNKDDIDDSLALWNDSFWDSVKIPQLDGTFDDDHVKKVRKRKMRSLRLGLSKPKENKKLINKCAKDDTESNLEISEIDEINVSRDVVNSVSSLHLMKCKKLEAVSITENPINFDIKKHVENNVKESISDLVGKIHIKYEPAASKTYDIKNKYVPEAGTSSTHIFESENINIQDNSISDTSYESSPDDNRLGIVSFYDTSKIFDMSLNKSLDNSNVCNEHTQNYSNKIKESLNKRKNVPEMIILTPAIRPPTKDHVISSLDIYNIPKVKNLEPFYSDPNDVGDKVALGLIVLKLHSKLARDQKPFEKVLDTTSIEEWRQLLFLQNNEKSDEYSKADTLKKLLASNRHCILEPVMKPPTTNQIKVAIQNTGFKILPRVENNISHEEIGRTVDELETSQALGLNDDINNSIDAETKENVKDQKNNDDNSSLQISMQPDGSFLCFGSGDYQKEIIKETPVGEVDFLTLMLTEVHASVRGDLHPDPAIDSIQAIFIMISYDHMHDDSLTKTNIEAIVIDNEKHLKHLDRCVFDVRVTYVNNEIEIFNKILELVKIHDPDIMCGYEIEMNSWGYILERAQILGIEIVKEVSRITDKNRQKRWRSEDNEFEGRIIGRITFNVWRLFRHELALSSYSFENCMYEILKERVPKYSYAQLAEWWNHESRVLRWIPVEYYLTRLKGTARMLQKLDIINRTSELARLFGLQWWEVLSRGSQFRVESLMLRAARPLNLIALSPTVRQRATMRAPECLPLILEPESRFYSDPVIVLDFQSLYPSMMIAYNYCFSTCIGRVGNMNGDTAYEFGAWKLKIPKIKLDTLTKKGLIHWSPVGVGFVKHTVRRGVLPALLRRILAARQAVKKSMKQQTDEAVKKAMHSRQLGLKLIANVTYGYTAANFSGRMPCVEVGDSVVAKGRETLERAIKLVRENKEWNTKVVYGDTDSMFVLVPGGTRAEAFAIGQQIADAVTADNPSPVALKLEKVYQPCILQTKKRYVGYMYESPEQEKPIYEAKGIETVRRDGCPLGVKLLQQSLCELFDSGDMSRVKQLVQAALSLLAAGKVPLPDLMFTREYHGPTGYRPGAVAPPNEIANRIASRDRRAAPRAGERVSWVVAAGAPGAALVRLARSRRQAARTAPAPHCAYYAARVLLPPLHRCLSLLGADVFKWWCELGYRRGETTQGRGASVASGANVGIARYMWRVRCARCGALAARALCDRCAARAPAAAALVARLAHAQRSLAHCDTICRSCSGHNEILKCENMECPVFWRRLRAQKQLADEQDIVGHLPTQLAKESIDFW